MSFLKQNHGVQKTIRSFTNKAIKIALSIFVLSLSGICLAQTKTTDSSKVANDNFMDMGANTLTQIFGKNLDGNATGETTGFLEMLQKSELPEDQKVEYKNWYYLQAKDVTQKQKDSLGKAIEKKILEAERMDN